MVAWNIYNGKRKSFRTTMIKTKRTMRIAISTTRNAMDFIHITASVTRDHMPIICFRRRQKGNIRFRQHLQLSLWFHAVGKQEFLVWQLTTSLHIWSWLNIYCQAGSGANNHAAWGSNLSFVGNRKKKGLMISDWGRRQGALSPRTQ